MNENIAKSHLQDNGITPFVNDPKHSRGPSHRAELKRRILDKDMADGCEKKSEKGLIILSFRCTQAQGIVF